MITFNTRDLLYIYNYLKKKQNCNIYKCMIKISTITIPSIKYIFKNHFRLMY